MLKKLPLGIQTFREIINNNYLYVDKTKLIYDLINTGKYYFLSRPRRFGKSLLCSTFAEIFSGNKELFKDFYIYKTDWKWEKHPIIHLDFSLIAHETSQELKIALKETLNSIALKNNISLENIETLESRFVKIVEELAKQNQVVIIVDEYDKAIIDNLDKPEKAENIRKVLSNFYGTFKGLDKYIKFLFLTGVTKFSKTSIFSKLNNLNDLSMDSTTSSLLGYTQKELEFYFKDYINLTSKKLKISENDLLEKIKEWYNGFCFYPEAETVYNPMSILAFLLKSNFDNYWFETGTPTFLINLIKNNNYPIPDINKVKISKIDLGAFDLNDIKLETLLFQTGYLTIKDYNEKIGLYSLYYPNKEIKDSLFMII